MKAQGPIWLGLTERASQPAALSEHRRRSARWSRVRPMPSSAIRPSLLAGTVVGMVADLSGAAVLARRVRARLGAGLPASLAWAAMTLAFQPILRFYRLSPLWGLALPLIGAFYALSPSIRPCSIWRGRGGMWKGRAQAMRARHERAAESCIRQGPQGREFPRRLVAHRAAVPRRRSWPSTASRAPPTTSPTMPPPRPTEKLALLEDMRASLVGEANDSPPGRGAAHDPCRARDLDATTRSTCSTAFRRDVTKQRYADWDELIDYCRYSAMPVGRFVLDVHGESRDTWPANDALCAALQVINHLQDCAKDYRELDRVYIPLDMLAAGASSTLALAKDKSSLALRGVIAELARRTQGLLDNVAPLRQPDPRPPPGLEVGVIQTLAEDLTQRLAESRSPVRTGTPFARRNARIAVPQPSPFCLGAAWAYKDGPRICVPRHDPCRIRNRRPGRPGKGVRQLLLFRHAADAQGRARGHVRDLRLLPHGRRHRRRRHRHAARSAMRSWTAGATISTRSMPAIARRARRFPRWSRCSAIGLRKEDFLTVIDGMEMDVAEDIARPIWRRSISIATAWPARWGGFRSRCSAWRKGRASRSRIISAARCS